MGRFSQHKLAYIRQRARHELHTIEGQQRVQWLSQATFGALDIYQRGVSICVVSREEILEEIDNWLTSEPDNLATALFAPLITGD